MNIFLAMKLNRPYVFQTGVSRNSWRCDMNILESSKSSGLIIVQGWGRKSFRYVLCTDFKTFYTDTGRYFGTSPHLRSVVAWFEILNHWLEWNHGCWNKKQLDKFVQSMSDFIVVIQHCYFCKHSVKMSYELFLKIFLTMPFIFFCSLFVP